MDEGCVLHVYPDSLGFSTIGIGRLIDKRRGGGITQAEADMLLQNDLARIEADLDSRTPWWRGLDAPRRAVVEGMAFQMGVAGLLGFSSTLALVQAGQYAEAARQMLTSKWARQTPARAARLAEQMKTGEWQ